MTVTTMTATDSGWSSPRAAAAASEEQDQEVEEKEGETEEEEEGGEDLQPGGVSSGSW